MKKLQVPAILLSVFCAFNVLPPQVGAATVTFKVANGAWGTTGNWQGGTPTSSSDAIINNSGTANLASGNSVFGSLVIGSSAGGKLNISGGKLTGSNSVIGSASTGSGTATISSGSWINTVALTVGGTGAGVLNLNSGNVTVNSGTGTLTLAAAAGSNGTLNYAGGTLNVGAVNGGSGTATLNFINTGSASIGAQLTGTLAVNVIGGGDVTLTGSSNYSGTTTISNFTSLNVIGGQIRSDTGTLVIATVADDYGALVIGNSGTTGYVSGSNIIVGRDNSSGGFFGANGQIILNSGTLNVTGSIVVGAGGDSSFTMNGGNLTINGGTGSLHLGNPDAGGGFFGSSGTFDYYGGTLNFATITGSGNSDSTGFGSVNIHTTSFAPRIVGDEYANIGVSYLNSGTFVYTGSDAYSGGTYVKAGTLLVDGGSMNLGVDNSVAPQLYIENGSKMIIQNNAYVNESYFIVTEGSLLLSSGTVEAGDFTVGDSDSGTFNMTGGYLDTTFSSVGYYTTGIGAATISSGTWNSSGAFSIAQDGTGVLNVNGGTLNGAQLYIGLSDAASGTMNVSSGTVSVESMTVGNSGRGILNVNGGVVNITGSDNNNYIGSNSNGTGAITVSSGTLGVQGLLFLGMSGTGSMNITGGSVSTNGIYMGYYGASSGSVSISSGTWNNYSNFLVVGESGNGTLNIDGGVTNIGGGTGAIYLGDSNTGTGTLNFSGGQLNAGVVYSGNGRGTVNFTTTTSSTFTARLSSPFSGSLSVNQTGSGNTVLTGSSNFTGTTTISAGKLTVNGVMLNTNTVVGSGTLAGSGTTGNVTVNTGGVLAGTLRSGTVTVNAGGVMAPGNSPGLDTATALIVNAGATYRADINAPSSGLPAAGVDYDQTTLTGASNGFAETVLTLNSTAGTGSILRLNVGPLPPVGTYNPNGTNTTLDNFFVLKLSDGVDTISGRFARATLDGVTYADIDYSAANYVGGVNGLGSFTLNGQTWVITYQGDSATNATLGGNDVAVTLVAIPEPSTYAMLGLGLGALAFRARKRRAQ